MMRSRVSSDQLIAMWRPAFRSVAPCLSENEMTLLFQLQAAPVCGRVRPTETVGQSLNIDGNSLQFQLAAHLAKNLCEEFTITAKLALEGIPQRYRKDRHIAHTLDVLPCVSELELAPAIGGAGRARFVERFPTQGSQARLNQK